MNIAEMHVWFRQHAQQMGMQNVRAILPEQIDLLINTSITDTINQLIQTNIGLTNDRVITDNSKVSQINAFRTLYTVLELPLLEEYDEFNNELKGLFKLNIDSARIGKFTTNWNNFDTGVGGNKRHFIKDSFPSYLFLVDFSINYKKAVPVNRTPVYSDKGTPITEGGGIDITNGCEAYFDSQSQITNYFPVRLIDDAYLADTLNDFVLKPRLRSPIIVAYNNPSNVSQASAVYDENGNTLESNNVVLDLYIDSFNKDTKYGGYVLENGLMPKNLRVSFIKKPNKVRYAADIDGQNIDCDLPESMHVDILKHAVDLYRVAVNGSLYASQQQEQQQQREDTRNNYRNEGQRPQRQQVQ